MKKTIATLALLASSNAMALPAPRDPNAPQPPPPRKYCLKVEKDRDGSKSAYCDMTERNKDEHARLLSNGCTKDQVAITLEDDDAIRGCMPPGVAQL